MAIREMSMYIETNILVYVNNFREILPNYMYGKWFKSSLVYDTIPSTSLILIYINPSSLTPNLIVYSVYSPYISKIKPAYSTLTQKDIVNDFLPNI